MGETVIYYFCCLDCVVTPCIFLVKVIFIIYALSDMCTNLLCDCVD